jgi:alpha/beta superfamily hydrolase
VPRHIESHFIAGPTGRLEALLEEPEEPATHVCLVCHPHPLYGGSMHNKVVYRIARGFRRGGAAVLRFNFRGVNKSEGVYDHGIGEIDDARAALGFLRGRYPDLPFSLAGFSFGSRVTLQLGCSFPDSKPEKLVAAGFPLTHKRFEYINGCGLPKHFIQSTHDEYGSVADLTALFDTFPEPKSLQFIEAKDHFFGGALQQLEDAVAAIAQTAIVRL